MMRPGGTSQWVTCARMSFGVLSLLSMAACAFTGPNEPAWKAAVAGDGAGNPSLMKPSTWEISNLPKSRSGNRATYTVFDKSYTVLDSAENFSEWGVASWYGRKFHGRQTASGDVYDMYLATAAHRQLPLPTFVKVTRVDNNRSIVVKVNDRGPFVHDRIIDLSYAAAFELGMLETGTADVYIEALSTHIVAASDSTAGTQSPNVAPQQIQETASGPVLTVAAKKVTHFVQVGAYANQENAEFMREQLQRSGDLPVLVDFEAERALYRVRIGPLTEGSQMDEALATLASTGIEGYKVSAVR